MFCLQHLLYFERSQLGSNSAGRTVHLISHENLYDGLTIGLYSLIVNESHYEHWV